MLLRLSVVVISGLLLWTALDKILHWQAFLGVLSGYPHVHPRMVPAVAGIVVAGELFIAVSLWPMTLRRYALVTASVIFGGFAAAVGILYATRGAVPCGCSFSPLASNAGPEHILLNILLAALAFSVWRLDDVRGGGMTPGGSREPHGASSSPHSFTNIPEGVCHEAFEDPASRAAARGDARDDRDHRTC